MTVLNICIQEYTHTHTHYTINSHKAGKVKDLQLLLRMRRGNGWENVGKESHTIPQNSCGRFIGGKERMQR